MRSRRAPWGGEGGYRGTGAPRSRNQPFVATLFPRVLRVAGGKASSVGSPKNSLSVSTVSSVLRKKADAVAQNAFLVSTRMVTGPSLSTTTRIMAAKRPVATVTPRSRTMLTS